MSTGRPDEPDLIGDSEQIRRFHGDVRARKEWNAAETGAPPSALASAIETRDHRRNDAISALDTRSSGYPGVAHASRGETMDVARGPRWDTGCPYRGLLPFDQDHAWVFFGRRRLTAELVVKLGRRLAGPSMVVVSGASGAGKSSLLRAGLLPALAAGIQLKGSDSWPRVVMTPTGDPLTELATRLAALSHGDAADIRHRLAAGSWPFAAARDGRLILVVDQFEEVFTLAPGRGDAGQQAFIAALCAAASQPSGPRGEPAAMVVIAVRGDFWAGCAAHAGLAQLMQDGMFVVGPMTGTELREAITGPAATAGLQVDADLAGAVLADLRTAGQDEAEGILPLLSQAMMLTWGRRDGNRLTVQGYHETGGVVRSVEFAAEAVYEALPDAGQQIAKEIFRALVVVGSGGQLARRAVPRAELAAGRRDASRRAVDTVLEAFASSRLLVLDGDTAQIAHDVLLRAWPRLRGWLDSEQANWILYTQLQEDAAEWATHGHDSSFLYRGSQLAAVEQAAERWAADPARYPDLSGDQAGFLAASHQQAARSARMRRVATLTLALLLVLSAAGAGIAALADRTADQQRNAAVSNQLAAESEVLDATNPVTAASLATAAWKIDPTAEAQTSLLDVLAQPERAAITVPGGNLQTFAFSPDGKRFATTTESGQVQIWDAATLRPIGKPLTIPQDGVAGAGSVMFGRNDTAIDFYGGANSPSRFWNITTRRAIGSPFQFSANPISSGIFSPDGKVVATGAVNGDLGFLNVATHREIGAPLPNLGPLAFSPNGKLLAVGGIGNGVVRLMNVATHQLVGPIMPGSTNYSPAAAFSPDGNILAVTGQDSVSFWDVATGRMIGKPLDVSANGVSFSPDGKIVATISPDGTRSNATTVNLWDAASHQELGGTVTADATALLGFSPDSTMVITTDGSTINFWDVAIGRQIGGLIGGTWGPVLFSPDGRILAAATPHGAALWNVATRREIGQPIQTSTTDGATDVAFSPDGKMFATAAGRDRPGVQLWDVGTAGRIGRPTPEGSTRENAVAVAFSPNGKYLLLGGVNSGGGGGKAWLWDIQAHRLVGRPMTIGGASPTASPAAVFSPNGTLIATADQQVRLFSATTQRPVGVPLASGTDGINDMVFSPDGSMIAVATNAGVTLWDVASQRQIGTAIDVNVGQVDAVAFSPDGTILAAADADGAIRLWDVASHEQIGSPLAANNNSVTAIAFSPDGTILAAASSSGATRLWGVALTEDVVSRACAIAGGSMTRQQWSSYVQSEPFQATCP